jgi:hypothetical protein
MRASQRLRTAEERTGRDRWVANRELVVEHTVEVSIVVVSFLEELFLDQQSQHLFPLPSF